MRYDTRSDFLKTACRRLDDARELLTEPRYQPNRGDRGHRHLSTARYLAGYAVECALKVYLISHAEGTTGAPVQTWSEVLDQRSLDGAKPDLSGARSHSLPSLLNATDLAEALVADADLLERWHRVAKWDYAERYMGRPLVDREATERFVDDCVAVHDWIRVRV